MNLRVPVGRGRGMDSREFGINRYPLLYLKEITNKDLLHGTGTLPNVMRGPGWERSLGRMDTCMCTAESLHCSFETNTTLLIGYTPKQKKKLKKEKKQVLLRSRVF